MHTCRQLRYEATQVGGQNTRRHIKMSHQHNLFAKPGSKIISQQKEKSLKPVTEEQVRFKHIGEMYSIPIEVRVRIRGTWRRENF